MTRIKNYPKRPQTKIAGKYVQLTEEYTNVPGYKMSECIKDALVICERNWLAYLERGPLRWLPAQGPNLPRDYKGPGLKTPHVQYFEPNPLETDALRNDPNLWIALQAKGWVCISKEEILAKAKAHLEELAKA